MSTVVAKLASFGSQLVLGWLLSKEDFAVYALAISISSLVTSMRNGGIHRILIQRGKEYDSLASPLFKLALLFNLLAALLIVISIPWAVKFFETPALSSMLNVVALSIPLSTPAIVWTAKLSIDLRFVTVSKIHAASAIVRHASAVMFALSGMGPLSFVLPLLVVAAFDTIVAWLITGVWLGGHRLTSSIFHEVWRASRWVIFGTLGIALALQGDYLVLGRLESKTVLGEYFFGFQLISSFVGMLTSSFAAVLLPTFVRLSDQPDRQAEAFLKVIRVVAFTVSPFFFAVALLANPAIHILWAGKWDSAIVVAQLFALSAPFTATSTLSAYMIEAHGRWRLWSFLLIGNAIGTLTAAIVGACWGDLLLIALCVTGHRIVFSLVQGLLGCWVCRIPFRTFYTAVTPPILAFLLCALACFLLFEGREIMENLWLKAGATAGLFLMLVGLTSLTFFRTRFIEAAIIFRTPRT